MMAIAVVTSFNGRVGPITLGVGDIPALTLSKISDAGTAAAVNTGTAAGNVPLNSDGSGLKRLPPNAALWAGLFGDWLGVM